MKLSEINMPDSFYAKNQVESLKIIFQIVINQKQGLISCESTISELDLIENIRLLSNEIYSACEIINQFLIAIYRNDERYRGTQLKRGFNYNFKEVYNASVKKSKELNGIYKDKFIFSFFYNAKTWFIELHDIRTQETHYEVGKIEKIDGKRFYVNKNRNGVSKQLYSNPSNEIKIEISDFLLLVEEFLQTEEIIASLLMNESK